jgi:hypothetical protein
MAGGAFLFKVVQTSGLLPPNPETSPAVVEKPAAPVDRVARPDPAVDPSPEPVLTPQTAETDPSSEIVQAPEAPLPDTPPAGPVQISEAAPPRAALPEAVLPEAVEPAPEARPPEPAAEAKTLPEFYGTYRVPKDDTLYRLMEIVYGSYRKEYVDTVMKANPKIKDPNQIIADRLIRFPVIHDTHDLWANTPFCIRLATETEFAKAIESVKHYRQRDLDVRILPLWDGKNGFVFPVVVNKAFDSLAQADSHKKQTGMEQGICESIFAGNDGRKPL